MKVVLAYRAPDEGSADPRGATLPVGLRSVATRLQADGHDASVANFSRLPWKQVEKFLADAQPQLVGISCFTFNRHPSVRLARLARRACPGVVVVMGGPHASVVPELLLQRVKEIDAIAVGEAEETLAAACRRIALSEPLAGVPGLATRGAPLLPARLPDVHAVPGALTGLQGAGIDPQRDLRHVLASRRRADGVARREPPSIVREIADLRAEFGIVDVELVGPGLVDARWLSALGDQLLSGEHPVTLELRAEPREIARAADEEALAVALLGARAAGLRRVRFVLEDDEASELPPGVLAQASGVLRAAGIASHLTLRIGGLGASLGTAWLQRMRAVVRSLRPQKGVVEARRLLPGTTEWAQAAAEERLDVTFWMEDDRAEIPLIPEGAIERASAALDVVFREVAREAAFGARDLTALESRDAGAWTQVDWGDYRLAHDDAEEAERRYRLAAAAQPWSPFPWLRLAALFRRGRGDRERESAALKQALQRVPKLAEARDRLDELRREAERGGRRRDGRAR